MHPSGDRFIEIARIGKAHGLDGTVKVLPGDEKPVENYIRKDQVLYLESRRGDLIPARIQHLRVEIKRNLRSFFVKFDHITNRSLAEQFQDVPVYLDRSLWGSPDVESPSLPDIIGFEVVDSTGIQATVTGILESPAHPIIEMETENETLLIPWVSVYVCAVDIERRIVNCRDLEQFITL